MQKYVTTVPGNHVAFKLIDVPRRAMDIFLDRTEKGNIDWDSHDLLICAIPRVDTKKVRKKSKKRSVSDTGDLSVPKGA